MTTASTTAHRTTATTTSNTSAEIPAALSVQDVSVSYPDGRHPDGTPRTTTVLHEANLSVERGEFAVILGPSGSGKSTLLSVAAGLVVPDAGRVLIEGADLTALDEKGRTGMRREQISVVFQQPNLLPALRVRDQLLVTRHLAGVRGRRLRAERDRADALLERVGMERYADRLPHELSGGQRQRVNIARALFTEPALLLVDEPTSALDHERARSVVDLLVGVTRELSVATVMVTHDEEFAEVADRMIALRDGRVTAPAA